MCEVRSSANVRNDVVTRFRAFQRNGAPHYWLVDPEREVLTVNRWTEQGYRVALQADRSQVVRAEPFDAVDLRVGLLFGRDAED